MNLQTRTLEELRTRRTSISGKTAVVGLDGFVDRIVHVVGVRRGPGEDFESMPTIEAFGRRVIEAAGRSANIELYPRMERVGGNGPLMAGALLAAGLRVTCIGAFGAPALHPAFQELSKRATLVSLCEPAMTTAMEFGDGKVMLGMMKSFDEITYARILEVMGEGALFDCLSRADLVALTNWTMLPHMAAIIEELATRVFPVLPPRERLFFFDLADPAKRSPGDLALVLRALPKFQAFGQVTLGLNLSEALRVSAVLGLGPAADDEQGLRAMARRIREQLEIATVVVHPVRSAACATREDTWWVPGPYAEKPLLTTGAGDQFNGGFMTAQLLGLSLESCLVAAVGTSGFYVRTGRSPTLGDLESFLAQWH